MKNLQQTTVQIKDSVRRLYDLQQEKKKFEQYYEQVRKKEQLSISNFMYSNLPKGEESFDITLDEGMTYYTNHVRLKVTKVRTKKITWILDKLKSALPKGIYKEVVTKTYTITDIDGLVNYLKSCGVDAKKFKSFISATEKVDETKLDNYYQTGVVKAKQLEDCYTIKMGEPYIRLTETK